MRWDITVDTQNVMPHEKIAEIKYVIYIMKHNKICLAGYWRGEKILYLAETTGAI